MAQQSAAMGVLFGQNEAKEIDFCLPAGLLVGVLGLGIWAILRVKRWRDEECATDLPAPEQQLEHYQRMVDDGLLDEEEFARIKTQVEFRRNAEPQTTEPSSPPQAQPPDISGQEK